MSSDQSADRTVRHATDPTLVRSIVEERGGYPAHAPQSEGQGDEGLLRIGFRDRDEDLKEISWEEFREGFDEKDLAAVYADEGETIDGSRSIVLRRRSTLEEQT